MLRVKPSRSHVELRVTGSNLNPSELDLLFSRPATERWKSSSSDITQNHLSTAENGWTVSTKSESISPMIDDHLDWLFEYLSITSHHLAYLRRNELDVRLIVQSYSSSEFLELRISQTHITQLNEWKFPMFFDCWKNEDSPYVKVADDFSHRKSIFVFSEMRILQHDLIPQVVTEQFGIEPDDSWIRDTIGQYGQSHPTGGWLLSSRSHIESDNLNVHLDWLLGQLDTRKLAHSLLCQKFENLKVFIMVRCNTLGFNRMLHLEPDSISRLEKLGLGLSFLIAFK